jgi:hypothetical protein
MFVDRAQMEILKSFAALHMTTLISFDVFLLGGPEVTLELVLFSPRLTIIASIHVV